MTPGIFSTVFARSTLDQVLAAMVAAGFDATQFHLGSAVDVADPRQSTLPASLSSTRSNRRNWRYIKPAQSPGS